MTMTCPHCTCSMDDGQKYCPSCGAYMCTEFGVAIEKEGGHRTKPVLYWYKRPFLKLVAGGQLAHKCEKCECPLPDRCVICPRCGVTLPCLASFPGGERAAHVVATILVIAASSLAGFGFRLLGEDGSAGDPEFLGLVAFGGILAAFFLACFAAAFIQRLSVPPKGS